MPQRAISRRTFLGVAAGGAAVGLLPGLAGPAHAAAPRAVADLACWGDSLTYGVGGNGTTYPDVLAAELGRSVYNAGVIGERSSGVATRQGGRRPDVRIPAPSGDPLPPGTFKINVDQYQPWYERTMVIQEEGVLPGFLGDLRGTLNKQGDYANEFTPYYFSRDQGVERPPAGEFRSASGVEYERVDQIIWAGHNDLRLIDAPRVPGYLGDLVVDVVKGNLARMVDYARPGRHLVLSLLNGKRAGNGRVTGRPTEYHRIVVRTLNPALADLYGPEHYLDVRTWLVRDALEYGNVPPTPQDLRDIEEDIPPSSLTVASATDPHLNALGYSLLGQYLAERLVALGWYRAG